MKRKSMLKSSKCQFISLLSTILVAQIASSSGELFSSVAQLKHLTSLEFTALKRIDNLLHEQEAELELIKEELLVYRNESKISLKEGPEPEELAHPISAFHRLKRISEERKLIEFLEGLNPSNRTKELPGEEEYEGAIEALLRLQKTYQLRIEDLAEGIITSKSIKNPYQSDHVQTFKAKRLTANDCFEISKFASKLKDVTSTILWAEEALKLAKNRIVPPNNNNEEDLLIIKFEILQILGEALHDANFISQANATYFELAELLPDKKEVMELVKTYSEQVRNITETKRPADYGYEKIKLKLGGEYDSRQYDTLCRGERLLPETNYSQLGCFYLNTSSIHPYFRLWKIKVEEAGKYPHLVQFHDVITDEEIEALKQFTDGKLSRTRVGLDGPKRVSNVRTSQASWVKDDDDPLFAQLSRRIEGITGLNSETMEYLQVGNYGLGGHYIPHRDHVHDEEVEHPYGNRIATWMFYLSDVTLGGATVFPTAGYAVWPRKGSAAFWYNLNTSGQDDPGTFHGGCPVLIGSKWVANKWIRDLGQIFYKPCLKEKNSMFVVESSRH